MVHAGREKDCVKFVRSTSQVYVLYAYTYTYRRFRESSSISNLGSIHLYVDKKTALKIVQTATVTFIDMISNVGGTLGLFCGMSILSLVEMAYWAWILATRSARSTRK